MARYPVVTGGTPNSPLVPIVDTQGQIVGVVIQNVSATEFWVSENAGQLQQVSAANLPQVGLHFPADSVPPWQLVLPRFKGKLYARAQNSGAQCEAIVYDIGCTGS